MFHKSQLVNLFLSFPARIFQWMEGFDRNGGPTPVTWELQFYFHLSEVFSSHFYGKYGIIFFKSKNSPKKTSPYRPFPIRLRRTICIPIVRCFKSGSPEPEPDETSNKFISQSFELGHSDKTSLFPSSPFNLFSNRSLARYLQTMYRTRKNNKELN